MPLFDTAHLSDWLSRLRDLAASPAVLESLFLQLGSIVVSFLAAWGIRVATRSWTDRLADRLSARYRALRFPSGLRGLPFYCYAWLLLVLVEQSVAQFGGNYRLIGIAASLTGLWIVIRASALLIHDPLLARAVAAIAWVVAALDIMGLLPATVAVLDNLALTVGTLRVSVLLVIKAVFIVAILLWIALGLSRLIDSRVEQLATLSPSVRALTGNLVRIVLVVVALLIGLNTVGIDLTAFAVFSGAVGVGLGFGLQKIVSNFVSGIILLLERSIKPGDVIEVGSTFGSVTYLGARYASVRGRDGKEYLIPNENLITNEVVNWSYSSPLVRLDVSFGVGYGSDLHKVREIAVAVAKGTGRVIASPAPVCHITGFGDSAVDLLLRFWIEDPADGVTNIRGDVLLGLWGALREHHIELPFPQRDLHIRDLPVSAPLQRAAQSQTGGTLAGQ